MQDKSFSEVITFTRSTTGTFLNPATGLLETAAINVPRLESAGLLFEQQRVNMALRSTDFTNATWAKGALAVASAPGILAPDGTTATKFTEDTSTGVHRVSQGGITATGATKYCRSVFAKADGSGRRLYLETDIFGNWVNPGSARFNLDTGVIEASTVTLDAVGMEPWPNGWYRCWIVATTVAAPPALSFDVQMADATGPSYTGNGTAGMYAWGAQFEAGDGPSSIIPTVAAQVTRAADLAYVAASTWLNADEGTLFVETQNGNNSTSLVLAHLGTSVGTGRISAALSNVKLSRAEIVNDAGVSQFAQNLGAEIPTDAILKQAVAYLPAGAQFSSQGLLGAVSGAVELPTIDRIVLGARGVSAQHMHGYIRRIKYFPYRLTAIQLQALTT